MIDRLAGFASRPGGIAVIGLWAAAEAIVLPIVPDVGVCLLLLAAPRRLAPLFLSVVAGALAGTVLLAAMTAAAPAATRSMLQALPGIDPTMLSQADAVLADRGVAAFGQLGPGAPLKVYTEAWVRRGGDTPGLLAGTVLNRLTRLGPAMVVAAALGWLLAGWIRRYARWVLVAYGLLWIVVYAVYLA